MCLIKTPIIQINGKVMRFSANYIFANTSLICIDSVQEIKLPSISFFYSDFASSTGFVGGWGQLNDCKITFGECIHYLFGNGYESKSIQYTKMKVISNKDCAKYYPKIGEDQFCALYNTKNKMCIGDVGSPLMLNTRFGAVQIGIVLHELEDKCKIGYPVIFSRITSHLNWIKEISGVEYFHINM